MAFRISDYMFVRGGKGVEGFWRLGWNSLGIR